MPVEPWINDIHTSARTWCGVALRVASPIWLHPADDRGIMNMRQPHCILLADHRHPRGLQVGKLPLGRTVPKRQIHINAGGFIFCRLTGALQPDRNWEIARIRRGAVLPLAEARRLGGVYGEDRKQYEDHDEAVCHVSFDSFREAKLDRRPAAIARTPLRLPYSTRYPKFNSAHNDEGGGCPKK